MSDHLKKAVTALQTRDYQAASSYCEARLREDPDDLQALRISGVANAQAGRLEEAEAAYTRVLSIRAGAADFSNLGNIQRLAGKLDAALVNLLQALQEDPGLSDARLNLAMVLRKQGKFQAALDQLDKIPGDADPDATLEAAINLRELQQLEQSRKLLTRLHRQQPDNDEVLNELGLTQVWMHEFDAAITSFRAALQLAPDNVEAHANLAQQLEFTGDIEAAGEIAAAGLDLDPGHAMLNLVQARIDHRCGRLDAAVARLRKVYGVTADTTLRREMKFELAHCLGEQGQYDDAWRAFCEANRERDEPQLVVDEQPVAQYLAACKANETAFTERGQDSSVNPVFLIGLPRGGTTLLGQILNAHSALHTLDEEPLLIAVDAELRRQGINPNRSAQARIDWQKMRDVYWRAAAGHGYAGPQLLIDKNPANSMRTGTLMQLFPAAQYIFLVRHPLDAVLSAFMQDFAQRSILAKAEDYAGYGEIFATALEVWDSVCERLQPNHMVIRYEDLVEHSSDQIRALIGWLGLDWEPAVLETGSRRQSAGVTTPSYHQVKKPLYKGAKFRWLKYREFIPAATIQRLRPWIDQFNYSVD